MQLDDLLKIARDWAHDRLITKGETGLMPVYLLSTAEDELKVVWAPWPSEDVRRQYMLEAARAAAKFMAVAGCFISEAWMVTEDNPFPGSTWHAQRTVEQMGRVAPADNPKRIEIVQAIATDGDTTKAHTWQIVRTRPNDEAAPVIALIENKQHDGGAGHYEGPGITPLALAIKAVRIVRARRK